METAKKVANKAAKRAEWVWENKKKVAAALLTVSGAAVAAGYELGWVAPGWVKVAGKVLGLIAGMES
jgi:hypothetical protein